MASFADLVTPQEVVAVRATSSRAPTKTTSPDAGMPGDPARDAGRRARRRRRRREEADRFAGGRSAAAFAAAIGRRCTGEEVGRSARTSSSPTSRRSSSCCSSTAARSTARTTKPYGKLFARDGEWFGGGAPAKGPKAIEERMRKTFGPESGVKWTSDFHVFTNPIVNVDGDKATAWSRWLFISPGADGKPDADVRRALRRRAGARERRVALPAPRGGVRHGRRAPEEMIPGKPRSQPPWRPVDA